MLYLNWRGEEMRKENKIIIIERINDKISKILCKNCNHISVVKGENRVIKCIYCGEKREVKDEGYNNRNL